MEDFSPCRLYVIDEAWRFCVLISRRDIRPLLSKWVRISGGMDFPTHRYLQDGGHSRAPSGTHEFHCRQLWRHYQRGHWRVEKCLQSWMLTRRSIAGTKANYPHRRKMQRHTLESHRLGSDMNPLLSKIFRICPSDWNRTWRIGTAHIVNYSNRSRSVSLSSGYYGRVANVRI